MAQRQLFCRTYTRTVLRVLREWGLARFAPASPLARACELHLLCRDAGFVHDAGMKVMAGVHVYTLLMLAAVRSLALRGAFCS